jgi:hypothetical protein
MLRLSRELKSANFGEERCRTEETGGTEVRDEGRSGAALGSDFRSTKRKDHIDIGPGRTSPMDEDVSFNLLMSKSLKFHPSSLRVA